MPARGTTAMYRPIPADFRETFIRVGWEGIEAEYRVHWRTVARWINVLGRAELVHARRAFVEAEWEAARRRRKNYVLGNRLSQGLSAVTAPAPKE